MQAVLVHVKLKITKNGTWQVSKKIMARENAKICGNEFSILLRTEKEGSSKQVFLEKGDGGGSENAM